MEPTNPPGKPQRPAFLSPDEDAPVPIQRAEDHSAQNTDEGAVTKPAKASADADADLTGSASTKSCATTTTPDIALNRSVTVNSSPVPSSSIAEQQQRQRWEFLDAPWRDFCERLPDVDSEALRKLLIHKWVQIYNDQAFAMAARWCCSGELAKDAVQKSLLIAVTLPCERIREPQLFPRMMVSILRNVCRNLMRSRREILTDNGILPTDYHDQEYDDQVELFAAQYALHNAASNCLSDADCELLHDRHICGYSLKELAQRHGCALTTIHRRLRNIQATLKAKLERLQ